MDSVLYQALIYLAAGVIAAPIANRLGLGSVLGYLAAGVLIGPVFHLVGAETEHVKEFAEFGVVMMLFVIGLELQPRKLWEMRDRLVGLGGLQLLGTMAALAGLSLAFGLQWATALTIGGVFALSSTAIVLQTLQEKGWLKTPGGQSSFAVLLFQDIAVIPMLALLPMLAAANGGDHASAGGGHGGHDAPGWLAQLPVWVQAIATIGAIALVIVGGRYVTRPLFRFIANSNLSEIFTATTLLLVVAIAALMTQVGLSPALGAFLAGVVLADSEYRHELESDLGPFKALLLGLFFITVGAGMKLDLLLADPAVVLALALTVMTVKGLVLAGLGRLFGLTGRDTLLMALGLCQAGEFAFVLIGLSGEAGLFTQHLRDLAALVVTMSMLLTPVAFILFERLSAMPLVAGRNDRQADVIDEEGEVIIAGIGRFGQVVNRLLSSQKAPTVVIDHAADAVDAMTLFEQRAFYGDASRPEVLRAAGIARARAIVVAIDDREKSVRIVDHVKRHYPSVRIIARAFDRVHVYELQEAGAHEVIRELFAGSLEAGVRALVATGRDEPTARRMAELFRTHDEETLSQLAQLWDRDLDVTENPTYIEKARQRTRLLAEAMRLDEEARASNDDRPEAIQSPAGRSPDA